MKQHPLIMKFASLISVAFGLAMCAAEAQTSVYYTSGSGAATPAGATFGGTLESIGYDSYQLAGETGIYSDPGNMGVSYDGFGYFFSNFTFGALPETLSDGSVLESVTLRLFAEGVSPKARINTFQIYYGLDGTGGIADTFTVDPEGMPKFMDVTVNKSIFDGGFSFGSLIEGDLLVYSTELNAEITQTPIIIANYAIPEPSIALLGSIGAMALLRRRRN